MNGRHWSLQVMLDILVLTSKPVHQVLNSASQSTWVSRAVGHATEIPRFHDLVCERNSSRLKRITNARHPKHKNDKLSHGNTETSRATTKHQTTCYMSHIHMGGCACANGKPNCFATSLAHNLSSCKIESRWHRSNLSRQNMYKCMCE